MILTGTGGSEGTNKTKHVIINNMSKRENEKKWSKTVNETLDSILVKLTIICTIIVVLKALNILQNWLELIL